MSKSRTDRIRELGAVNTQLHQRNARLVALLRKARNELLFYDEHLDDYHASKDTRAIIERIDAALAENASIPSDQRAGASPAPVHRVVGQTSEKA